MIHGGDQNGFFATLDVNGSGDVAVHEWIRFFETVKMTKGEVPFSQFLLYFERNAAAVRLQDVHSAVFDADPAVGESLPKMWAERRSTLVP